MARGGTRPGAGRPATGQNAATLTVWLPNDILIAIKRRAKQGRMPVNAYLQPLFEREFRPRTSRTSNRDRKAPRIEP